MPVLKLKGSAGAADKKAEVLAYTGPMPPRGVYRVLVKRLGVKINKNDDYMLNCVVEIHETGAKAKYNGFGAWWNGNLTEEGEGYVNQFLDAISGEKRSVRVALWERGPKVFEMPKKGSKKAAAILAIGPMKVQQEGMEAVVLLGPGNPYQGQIKMEVKGWLLPSTDTSQEIPESEDADDEEVEVDLDEDGDGVEDEVIDEDDEDGDVDGDTSDDDDDDDEPPF